MSEAKGARQAGASRPLIRSMARAALHLYDQFFARVTPFDLAIARVLLYGYCFLRLGPVSDWLDFRESIYHPVGMYQWLPLLSAEALDVMYWVAKVASLAALLGLAYRPSAILVLLTAPYLLGLENNFVKVNHGLNIFVLSLIPMAFARAADGLSLDAYIQRRRGISAPQPSGEYRWPVRAVWLLVAGMYCSAGISKLAHTGWEWALGDGFQRLLLRHHFTHSPPTELGLWIADSALLSRSMAFGSLLLELTCPLLLLGGRWALVFGGGLLALQGGIYLTLGVPFKPMIPVFLTFLPWERLAKRVSLLRTTDHAPEPEPEPEPERERAAPTAPSP